MADADLRAVEQDIAARRTLSWWTLGAMVVELRRLRGMSCPSCRHKRTRYVTGKACAGGRCEKWSEDIHGAVVVRCSEIGGCRAHQPREST